LDLNGILFPSPTFDIPLEGYENELIFIEKKKKKDMPEEHIPCILLQAKLKNLSKYFLVFFHGNAEDIFIAKEIAEKIKDYLYVNVLIVEYPGYSIYKGDKSADAVLEDSLTVFDFLTNYLKVESENIIIFGRSIGSAPATYLCSERKPGALILMSPFTSIRAVAENLVGTLMKFLISERFTNIEYIKSVSCPVMFIHGQLDTLIPFEHTLKLKDNCNCPYELILPEDMDHNNFHYEIDFIRPLREFLKRHTSFKSGETCDIEIPLYISELPVQLREHLSKENIKDKSSSFQNCFGVTN